MALVTYAAPTSFHTPAVMPFPKISLFAALGLLTCVAAAHGEILKLANGDHLKGKLVSHEAGVVVWEHPQLGRLTLPEAEVEIRPEVPTEDTSSELALAPVPSSGEAAAAHSKPKKAPEKAKWKSVVETGLTLQAGRNDRTDVNLRAESTFKRKRNDYRIQARYAYSKSAGTVNTNRTEGSFRWRRDLDSRWFGQTQTAYLAAELKGIDHNVQQNLGFGYSILKTERAALSLGSGIAGQYRELTDDSTGRSFFGEVFQDFSFKISPRLEMGEDFSANYSPSGRGIRITSTGSVQIVDTSMSNYTLNLKTFLRGKITETLSLALRYEYEFDNTYVSANEKADQRITTSLGYTF